MSEPSFRTLDARTGWDAVRVEHLIGVGDPAGLRLGASGTPGAVHVADLAAWLPPARVARIAGFLYVAAPDRLRVLGPCDDEPAEVPLPGGVAHLTAVAAGPGLLAVVDAGAGIIHLLRPGDGRPLGRLRSHPVLVAVTPWNLLAVVTRDPRSIQLIGLDGATRRRNALPAPATEIGMVGATLVLAAAAEPGRRRLYALDRHKLAATPMDALPPGPATPLTVGDDESWSIRTPAGVLLSFDSLGRPQHPAAEPVAHRFATTGTLLTAAIDSGRDEAVWHRVTVDADRPPGTRVEVTVATADTATPDPATPDPAATAATGADPLPGPALPTTDALIPDPGHRFLRVRVRLSGDGVATPTVRAIRAEFDVKSSIDALPAVYRADPDAEAFTRRFLALFDASLADLDDVIRQAPLLLHPDGYPDHRLGALARLCGIRPDPSWPPGRLRVLLERWPEIGRRLGTPGALHDAVEAIYQVGVLVEELGRSRPWGALGHCRLGAVRLFGAAHAPLRLGRGRLGAGRLDPGADPLAPAYGSGAYRCVVHVPAALAAADRAGLEALVRAFLPGHVVARIRYAEPRVIVGGGVVVGVDTALGGPPAGVLRDAGDRAVVLSRSGPLGSAGPGGGTVTVGRRALGAMPGKAR